MFSFSKIVIAALSAAALFGAIASIAPEAKAWDTRCRTDSLGKTRCTDSSGSSYRSRTDSFGTTRFSGFDSNGSRFSGRCRANSLGATRCSSY